MQAIASPPPASRTLLLLLLLLLLLAFATGGVTSDEAIARVYLTTTDQRILFELQPPIQLGPPPAAPPTICINTTTRHQRMVGFGAAITDAAAWVLHSSPPAVYESVMKLLFAPFPRHTPSKSVAWADRDTGCAAAVGSGLLSCATDLCPTCLRAGLCDNTCGFFKVPADMGLGISVLRIAMGVSDFSMSYGPGNVTYADTPGDWALAHFSTDHDDVYILPVLRQARLLNPGLKIIASPWTAPVWLKDPPGRIPDQIGGGTLLDTEQAYDTYAAYFVRFVQDYVRKGVPVDYITLQNEPGHGGCGTMPCMLLPVAAEARLAVLVGKKLAAAGLGNATRILGYDHNWGNGGHPSQPGPEYPIALLNNTTADAFVAGVAWHCYGGAVTAQTPVHNLFPTKEAHLTECSGGTWSGPWASNFVNNMQQLLIGNANNWGQSTLFWNMALDEHAGPHCQGGACCTGCRGVITVPNNASTVADVTRNVEFYSLAHLSALVTQGSQRIETVAPAGHTAGCGDYCSSTGCGWTKQYSCPWAPPGTSGHASNDGSVGYTCCCVDRSREAQPCGGNSSTGTPLVFTAFATPSPSSEIVLVVVNPTQSNQTMSVEVDGTVGFGFVLPPGAVTLVWDA